jgi:uncharacterized protein YceH (UPF0502 family)
MQPSAQKPLAFLEARILGVLVEKERTTPDIYPLTLNSLASGCNQKSARDPVINVKDSEVQAALDELRSRVLVLETYGASGSCAAVCTELRPSLRPSSGQCRLARHPHVAWPADGQRTSRQQPSDCTALTIRRRSKPISTNWHRAASGPLVTRLPRQAGAREHRWAHLLCGAASLPAGKMLPADGPASAPSDLEVRVARLETEVAELRAAVLELARKG